MISKHVNRFSECFSDSHSRVEFFTILLLYKLLKHVHLDSSKRKRILKANFFAMSILINNIHFYCNRISFLESKCVFLNIIPSTFLLNFTLLFCHVLQCLRRATNLSVIALNVQKRL